MQVRGVPAQPTMAPAGRRSAGTMAAAFYGRLVRHPWHDPEHDAYQLFYQRSLAMGWLDESASGGEGEPVGAFGLWAMNDAGWDHPLAAPGAGLIAWFQVEAAAVAGDRPLPVQPFLRCAWEAMTRAGKPDVSVSQILLPVQGIDASARPPYAVIPSMGTRGWFAECDPAGRTPVEVGVNSGRDLSVPAVAGRLTDLLGHLEQDVFTCESYDVTGRDDVLAPPFDDGFWNGPPLHGVVLRGRLAERSPDAAGWLAEVIADACAHLGVRSPLLITVTQGSRLPNR
ncbi:hypothetical protein AB0K60_27310 [Thermopolyspora sp. NPDC052614]|uniref:hypothetical protein n=1 Tax=Thermopolyspora sp. NPDC052614 TaxID=3155682 RepID=UPI00342B50E6